MRILLLAIVYVAGTNATFAQIQNTISADEGEIIITPIIHSSAQVEYAGKVIHIDPWSAVNLSIAKPADLILITDDPSHHLDPEAISQLRKPGAPVVLTETAYAKFNDGIVLSNGESGTFADIRIEAVGAYDMTPGAPYHPKGRGQWVCDKPWRETALFFWGRRVCSRNSSSTEYRRCSNANEFTSR